MNPENENEIMYSKPAQENPVAVFLASLESKTSRDSQLSALNVIYDHLTKGRDIKPTRPLKLEEYSGRADWVKAMAKYKQECKSYSFRCFWMDWSKLRFAEMTAIQAWLSQNYEPKSVRRYMAGVKGVLKAAWKMKLITADDYMTAIAMKRIRGESIAGRALSKEEIAAFLRTCQTGPRLRGMRDAAIFSLLVGCGPRRAEITALTMDDYKPDYGPGMGRIKLMGKGRKERYCYPQGGTLEALNQWVKARGNASGPLFPVIVMSDIVLMNHMSPQSIWVMIQHRQRVAGLQHFTPHDLRRTFISNLLDQPGVDMATASKLAGHSDPAVTARYDRRSDRTAEKAAATIEIPFQPRGEL